VAEVGLDGEYVSVDVREETEVARLRRVSMISSLSCAILKRVK